VISKVFITISSNLLHIGLSITVPFVVIYEFVHCSSQLKCADF
jgi:hypothetical protein